MTNANKLKDSFVSQALPVPSGAVAGDVVPLGTAGLRGVLKTARATTAAIAAGTAAPGLADGEATVTLLGCAFVLTLTLTTLAAQFAAIYRASNGTYTNDSGATGAVLIGYCLKAIGAPGAARVAIV